ncbi:MAG: phosphoglucosamine mutase [Planctomycetes bacterium]|nr:phosphoglucosamine mutase [Planctomycetota bacterium]
MALMMGVSGIRGIVGDTLTPQLAASAGCAMAKYVGGGAVVLGRDSRPSGDMVRSAVAAGLLAGGSNVIDIGIAPTPTTAIMVREHQAAGGIILTASHNPSEWNGIKFLTGDGHAPPVSVAQQLIDILKSGEFDLADYLHVGLLTEDRSANEVHVQKVLNIVDVRAIRSRRFKVVLDSVNGAGQPAGKLLLDELGCDVTYLNPEATGLFAHTPEPIAENLTDLCEQTKAMGADIGFAQDPDADRLAVVDEKGAFIGEEFTLVLGAKRIFETTPGPVCANLSTSRMIDDLAARYGDTCVVHRSAVGEANVVEKMKETGCVIGGEGNGGIIDPRIVYVRDSIGGMALVLDMLAASDQSLSGVVADLPKYEVLKTKMACAKDRIARVLGAVEDAYRSHNPSTIDGVRIDWPEGWVHVRGSNTEPIMRVIGEAADRKTAEELVNRVQAIVDRTP